MDPKLIEMCEKLGIAPELVEVMFTRPDWEFVILACAFLESVGKWRFDRLIERGNASPEAVEYHAWLDKSGRPASAGRILGLVWNNGHLSEASARFLLAFYRLRNSLAHDVRHMGFSFAESRGGHAGLRRATKISLGRAGDLGVDVRECVALAAMEQVILMEAKGLMLSTLTATGTLIPGATAQGQVTLPTPDAAGTAG